MNKQTIFAALVLAALPLAASAAGKRATAQFEVSFTVVESCTVRMGGGEPEVKCQFDTPYQKQSQARIVDPASAAKAPSSTDVKTGEQPVVIYF